MAPCTVSKIHRGARVIVTVWVDDVVVDRNSSIVQMRMPINVKIHAVGIKQSLEGCDARGANIARR
jgi:hypothetical protein